MYSNNIMSALAAEDETISRDYFESSVYRNILDMLASLNNLRKELRLEMITVGSARGFGKAAGGFAIKELGEQRRDAWTELMRRVPDNPWSMDFSSAFKEMSFSLTEPKDNSIFPSHGRLNRALMNARSMGMAVVDRLADLEWELNRVHLPMVEDLRKASLLLNDFIRDLPPSLPLYYPSEHYPFPVNADDEPLPPVIDQEDYDPARVAAYRAQNMLRQMKTWLASMTEKIKTRSEFDAAALERIAAEAAARAKAARQAEADAKAEAERQAAAEEDQIVTTLPVKDESVYLDRESRKSLQDAGEAKETAAKAAEVEKQIVTSDDVPDKGKGGVLLALAGGAAAFFFLS